MNLYKISLLIAVYWLFQNLSWAEENKETDSVESNSSKIEGEVKVKSGDGRRNNHIQIKPELQLSKEDVIAMGELELNGGPVKRSDVDKNRNAIFYSGNACWLDFVRNIKFSVADPIELKNVTLIDLASTMNKRIHEESGWKIAVSENAKDIRVSGILDKDIILSLTRLMHQESFYCRIHNGIIEFKKGARSPVVPEDKMPLILE